MIKTFSSIALVTLIATTFSACADKDPEPTSEDFRCKQENVLAPKWTCIPKVDGTYAGVGISEKSNAGVAHMRRVALANGRSNLAQQIQTQVKDKVEVFTRATGNGKKEVIDAVSTSVTKQVAKVDLQGSRAVEQWNAPSGAMYLLVTVSESLINTEVQKAVKSSFKNDDALWQQFRSEQALKSLDNEFPTH